MYGSNKLPIVLQNEKKTGYFVVITDAENVADIN